MDDEASTGGPRGDELLLYDYFKHLTSLVLITLGGLLLVMKDFDPRDARPRYVAATFLLVSLSGVLSFAGVSDIVRARYTGKTRHRTLQLIRIVAPLLLAAGLGLFMAIFLHRFRH